MATQSIPTPVIPEPASLENDRDVLIEVYYDDLFDYFLSAINDRDQADSLVKKTFAAVWETHVDLTDDCAFETILYTTALIEYKQFIQSTGSLPASI